MCDSRGLTLQLTACETSTQNTTSDPFYVEHFKDVLLVWSICYTCGTHVVRELLYGADSLLPPLLLSSGQSTQVSRTACKAPLSAELSHQPFPFTLKQNFTEMSRLVGSELDLSTRRPPASASHGAMTTGLNHQVGFHRFLKK